MEPNTPNIYPGIISITTNEVCCSLYSPLLTSIFDFVTSATSVNAKPLPSCNKVFCSLSH